MYVTANDVATFATAFDMSTVPVVTHEQALAEERTKKLTSATPTLKAPSVGPKKPQANGSVDGAVSAAAEAQKHVQRLMRIPELKAHGTLLRSSSPVELTESETEYVVTAIKHIYKKHIVLQYDIKNTIPDTILEEVSMVATPSEDDESLEEEFIIPVSKLPIDQPGTVYVSLKKVGDTAYPITSFTNVLKFTSKEIDPTSGEPDETGYEDEYQVEDLELLGSDYVMPAFAGSFDHVWEQTGANGDESSETLQLTSIKSITGKSSNATLRAPSAQRIGNQALIRALETDGVLSQTPLNNSRRPSPFSLWMVATSVSLLAHIPSSFMVKHSMVVRLLPWSEWLTPQRAE